MEIPTKRPLAVLEINNRRIAPNITIPFGVSSCAGGEYRYSIADAPITEVREARTSHGITRWK
tara:strand:+ start:176 stop:364 length:189 start_codon:yes stop_codon:yes gene_type:complete